MKRLMLICLVVPILWSTTSCSKRYINPQTQSVLTFPRSQPKPTMTMTFHNVSQHTFFVGRKTKVRSTLYRVDPGQSYPLVFKTHETLEWILTVDLEGAIDGVGAGQEKRTFTYSGLYSQKKVIDELFLYGTKVTYGYVKNTYHLPAKLDDSQFTVYSEDGILEPGEEVGPIPLVPGNVQWTWNYIYANGRYSRTYTFSQMVDGKDNSYVRGKATGWTFRTFVTYSY